MDDTEFKQFWDWLLDETNNTDAWWFDNWLEEHLEEWGSMEICKCGHRTRETETIWSKTHTCVLEERTKCKNCGDIKKIDDRRPHLIESIKEGSIPPKYLEVLKKEVGYEEE